MLMENNHNMAAGNGGRTELSVQSEIPYHRIYLSRMHEITPVRPR